MSYYERLDHGDPHKTYDYLVSVVRKRLEQARRDQNRDELHNGLARKGRSLAAWVAGGNPSGGESPRHPKGVCRTWYAKGACSKGDACAFTHDRDLKGKGAGRSQSPKKNDKGDNGRTKSPSRGESPRKKVCPYHLKGSCKKGKD